MADQELNDFILGDRPQQPTAVPAQTMADEQIAFLLGDRIQAPPQPSQNSLFVEVGRQVVAGYGDAAKMINQAGEFFSPSGSAAKEFFRQGKEYWNKYGTSGVTAPFVDTPGSAKEWEPQLEGRSLPGEILIKGARAFVPSVAGIGAATMNPMVGGAAIFSLFGGSQAQETWDKGIKLVQEGKLSEDDLLKASLINMVIEGGGETIADMLGAKFILNPLAATLKDVAKKDGLKAAIELAKNPAWVKDFAKGAIANTAVQSGTEYGQNYGETSVENAYGISKENPHEQGVEGFKGGLGLSTLLLPVGAVSSRRAGKNRQLAGDILSSPDATQEQKQSAAGYMLHELEQRGVKTTTEDILKATSVDGAINAANASLEATGSLKQSLDPFKSPATLGDQQALPNYAGPPLVVFPDGSTMTQAEAQQRNALGPMPAPATPDNSALTSAAKTSNEANLAAVQSEEQGLRATSPVKTIAGIPVADHTDQSLADLIANPDTNHITRNAAIAEQNNRLASAAPTQEGTGGTNAITATLGGTTADVTPAPTPKTNTVAEAAKILSTPAEQRVPADQMKLRNVAQRIGDAAFAQLEQYVKGRALLTRDQRVSVEKLIASDGRIAPAAKAEVPTLPAPATQQALADNEDGQFSQQRVTELFGPGAQFREASSPDVRGERVGSVMRKFLTQMGRLTGTQVIFFNDSTRADGVTRDGNTVFINTTARINPLQVLGHETTHILKKKHYDAWKAIRDAVEAGLGTDKSAALLKFAENYWSAPQNKEKLAKLQADTSLLDSDAKEFGIATKEKTVADFLMDEMIADMGGEQWSDQTFWEGVFKRIEAQHGSEKAKGIISRLVAAVKEAINKFLMLAKMPGFGTTEKLNLDPEHLKAVKSAIEAAYAEFISAERRNEPAGYAAEREKLETLRANPKQEKPVDETNLEGQQFPDVQETPKREDRIAVSTEVMNRSGVIVGAKPGEFGWTVDSGRTPPPIGAPVQRQPDQARIGQLAGKVLSAKGAKKLFTDLNIGDVQIRPTRGSWLGKPEYSYVITGPDFESSDLLGKLLGFAWAQDMAITTEAVANPSPGTEVNPGIALGNGRKFDEPAIQRIINAAQAEGLDYTLSPDGYTARFNYGSWLGMSEDEFDQKVSRIAASAKMQMTDFAARTKANFSGDYGDAIRRLREVAGNEGQETGTAGPSDLFRRAADHLIVPYAKAVGAEGYRFDVGRFAERFGLTDAEAAYIRASLRPKSGLARSTAPIMRGDDKVSIGKSDTRSKEAKSNNTDVLWALQNRAAETGLIEPGDFSNEAKKTISEALADEVVYHLTHAGKSAIGWYDRALKKAMNTYYKVFPELRTDRHKAMMFKALLGITSQGNDVKENSKYASRIYYFYRQGHTISEIVNDLVPSSFGKQSPAITFNLLKLERLVDKMGFERAEEFFNKKMTAGEWNKILRNTPELFKENGAPVKITTAADMDVTGWFVFGPKIGSFINNLYGDYSTLTADLWFSRTWNRILGYSFINAPAKEQTKWQNFIRAIKAERTQDAGPKNNQGHNWLHGNDVAELSDDEFEEVLNNADSAFQYAEELYGRFNDSGFKEKSDARRSAKGWIEMREKDQAAPRSVRERLFQQRTVEDAQKLVKRRTGETITVADIQAALWYHEKDLFKFFGASNKKSEAADYADAAHNMEKLYRDGNLFYNEKPTPTYIYGQKGSYLEGEYRNVTGEEGSTEQGGGGDVQENGDGSQQSARRESQASYGTARDGAISVTGIHFSKGQRPVLDSRYYGTGMAGAEAKRLALLPQEYRYRINLYVNEGAGVTPESDVGAHAHSVTLRNIYDAGADRLYLAAKAKGDSNAFERSVKDSGFDGYYVPSGFGDQGVVVVLGYHSIQPEYHGGGYRANDMTPPVKSEPNEYQKRTRSIIENKTLPGGQMYGADWKRMMPKLMPEIDVSHLDDEAHYYKDQIVKVGGGVTAYSTFRAVDTESAEFKKWFKGSAVVDADGKPLVVYHGTGEDFTEFADSPYGTWVTSFEPIAETFAYRNGSGGNSDGNPVIMPLYVSASKVKFLSQSEYFPLAQSRDSEQNFTKLFAKLRKQGYQAVNLPSMTMDGAGDTWVVLQPSAVKSAISNTGEFDSANPDIRFTEKRRSDVFTREERRLTKDLRSKAITEEQWMDGMRNAVRKFIDEVGANLGDRESAAEMFSRLGINENSKYGGYYELRKHILDWNTAIKMGPTYQNWAHMVHGFASAESTDATIRYIKHQPYAPTTMQSTRERLVAVAKTLGWVVNKPSAAAPEVAGLLESTQRIVGDSGRQYDPDQKALFQRTGREVTDKSALERLNTWVAKSWKQGLFDQFAPFRGTRAYILMRLSKGAAGALEAFMRHGKLFLRDGATDADTSGGVIKNVFVPLGKETTDFLYWIAGNRAERLAMEGKERLFTTADIAAAKSLANGTTDFDYTMSNGQVTRDRTLIYRDSLKKFNEYNKNIMDLAEASGLIDGQARHLWEHEFYVPFYRVMEDDTMRGMGIKKGIVRQEAFKKLKGGEEKMGDLLSNTLANWAHLIDASAKNRAAKAAVETAVQMGVARPAVTGEKETVWYMDGGKKQTYRISDKGVMEAIVGLEYAGMKNLVMDVLTKPKHWLTMGVTASPFFKVRNLIRDSIQAIATSDLSYNAIGNVYQGFKLTDRDRQEYVSALAGGGLIRLGTMLEGNEVARTRQLIKQGSKDSHLLAGESALRKFYDKTLEPALEWYNELGNRGEEINRMSLYDQMIKSGMDHAEASLMARDLMDFSLQGSFTTIRFLAQVVPFFNARVQGLYKLGRASQENSAHMAVVTFMATLAGLGLMALAARDDDEWKRWKNRPESDKQNYWYFTLGGKEYRIPRPFELGAVAFVGERTVEAMIDNERDAGKRLAKSILDTAKNQLSMNPTPQAVKPILDIYSNRDSFRDTPIESMSMQRLEPTHRYTGQTSMPARWMSEATAGYLSPVQYDHLVQSYFGWMGAMAVSTADEAYRAINNSEPKRAEKDLWKLATGGMVREDPVASRYVSQMYDQAKELEQAHATHNQLRKEGKVAEATEFRDENIDKLKAYRSVEAVKKQESLISERIRMIERSEIHPAEKRIKIRELRERQAEIAARLAQ